MKLYNRALRDLIAGGRAEPGFVVSFVGDPVRRVRRADERSR
ncbi:hypothetical protein [Streptomyces griseofuscus]